MTNSWPSSGFYLVIVFCLCYPCRTFGHETETERSPDFKLNNNISSTKTVPTEEAYIQSLAINKGVLENTNEDECRLLLEKFSNSSSSFTGCANQYAKPIKMCRMCVRDFIDVRTYYYALERSQSEGINCKDILTSHDKVEIIKATFNFIVGDKGLWSKGFCSNCYTTPLSHSSNLTDITTKFFILYRTVQDCFNSIPPEQWPELPNGQVTKSKACTECQLEYSALKTFYKDYVLNDRHPYLDGICFDILDAMNETQHRWGSGQYNCGRQISSSVPLIVAILCVLITPVIFYLSVRFCRGGSGAQERVVDQRNFADIINHSEIWNTEERSLRSNSEESNSMDT